MFVVVFVFGFVVLFSNEVVDLFVVFVVVLLLCMVVIDDGIDVLFGVYFILVLGDDLMICFGLGIYMCCLC